MNTCSDFQTVRKPTAKTRIAGRWTKEKNHCQFYADSGAVLNYWKTTGRITFQGPELAAAELFGSSIGKVQQLLADKLVEGGRKPKA